MEIERINENTIKFYISYIDIEDLGFEQEEIWYNRERSEQLFWQMMDEVNYKEDFNVEGPLWIQVQALEKGLEIVVTKAKIAKNGDFNPDETIDDETIETMLEDKFGKNIDQYDDEHMMDETLWMIVDFNDFEDVIQLSYYFQEFTDNVGDVLYHYNNKYYLYIEFSQDNHDDNEQENIISQVLEFANDSDMSIHYLEEYGKKIFETDVFGKIRSFFPQKV